MECIRNMGTSLLSLDIIRGEKYISFRNFSVCQTRYFCEYLWLLRLKDMYV